MPTARRAFHFHATISSLLSNHFVSCRVESSYCRLVPFPSAAETELLTTIGTHGAPMRLIFCFSVLPGSVGLRGLVKGFEVEDVGSPGQHAAHGIVPICVGVLG